MKSDLKYYLIGLIAVAVVIVGAVSLHNAGMRLTNDPNQTESDASLPSSVPIK